MKYIKDVIIFLLVFIGLFFTMRFLFRIGPVESVALFALIFTGILFVMKSLKGRQERSSSDSTTQNERKPSEGVPKRFIKGYRGTARDVEKREVSSKGVFVKEGEDYLSFRLERNDDQGNVVELIPIEVRAREIPGRVIKDGDSVIVLGRRNRQGLMIPRKIFNVTNNLEIKVKKKYSFVQNVFFFPLALLFAASWPALIYGIVMMTSTRSSRAGQGILLILGSIIVMVIFYAIYIRR